MTSPYLEIRGLTIALRRDPTVRLLRSVDLTVAPGEVRGLVGESGAGKTMIGKAIFDILPRAATVVAGSVRLGGAELLGMRSADRRKLIARTSALIPQDPLTAFNPVRRVGPQMTDRLTAILRLGRAAARERALKLLAEVHIEDPERALASYPHQLSGGMRQRVLIAAAFAAEPKLIVADEPTTALDVTVQKQILRLIADMQARHGTALLFVTHDLAVVAKICQRVTVLFSGHVVEDADAASLFSAPHHAYSAALLAATPRYDRPGESLLPVPEEVIAATRQEIAEADAKWAATRQWTKGARPLSTPTRVFSSWASMEPKSETSDFGREKVSPPGSGRQPARGQAAATGEGLQRPSIEANPASAAPPHPAAPQPPSPSGRRERA